VDTMSSGPSPFDWLGHAMASFADADTGETTVVAVGRATSCESGQCVGPSAGKVTLMDPQGRNWQFDSEQDSNTRFSRTGTILATLRGRQSLEKFGFTVEMGTALIDSVETDVLLVKKNV
jgi:hypothetical protein